VNGESAEVEPEFSSRGRRRRFSAPGPAGAGGRGFRRFGRGPAGRAGGSVIVEFRGSKFALGHGVGQRIMVAEE